MQESYGEIFLSESGEYLNIISRCLVKLESAPSDLDSLNEIFRVIHTLKGMSATIGFDKLTRLSHQMEDLLDGLRSQKIKVSSQIIDTLFGCLDVLETLIQDIRLKKESEIDISPNVENLKRFLGEKEKPTEFPEVSLEEVGIRQEERKVFEKKKTAGFDIFKIKISLASDCAMKQVRAFLVITRLEKLGGILKSVPSISDLKQGSFGFSFIIVLATREENKVIRDDLLTISEVEKIEIKPLQITDEKPTLQAQAPSYIKKIQSMRIPVERIDKIMNLMGELSIAKIRLLEIVQTQRIRPLEEVAFAVDRLTTALQDEIMQTRLLPISYVLDTFPRIARDLARGRNKEVELEIIGSEIELDRAILDEIGDPLVHLVRNAIDHGIEGPEERKRLKKIPKGKVLIKVTRSKGQIFIEVTDDGKGIDFKVVGLAAVKRGLITEEEIEKLDEVSVLNLLTLPGFSTSEKVTEISGRGVGLDVVKTRMDALAGRVDFETKVGEGTKFILALPLSLAIIKAMLVRVGGEIFAIPLMNIRETIKIEKSDIKSIKNFEVIRLRDEVVPILRLDKELDLPALSQTLSVDESQVKRLSVVIIEYGVKSLGLLVSKVLGEQDIVVKPLGAMFKRIKGIAGATILADGRVALILDAMSLV